MDKFIGSLIILGLMGLWFSLGYDMGKEKAFEDIILEACWLNKESRDIECIAQISQ